MWSFRTDSALVGSRSPFQESPIVVAHAVASEQPARAPVALILAFLIFGVIYSVATPILEVSDENFQEAVIWDIASGRGLPVMRQGETPHFLTPSQEAGQPPLSYLLAAAATFWIHPPPPDQAMIANPQADIGSPDYSNRNRNLFTHSAGERFPWHGLALAVHLQRFLSLLYGAVALAGVYRLARLALPASPDVATLAMALCAFNPMVLFIAASADNDALAMALCTWTLTLLAEILRGGLAWRRALLGGLLLGLTMLTKLNAAAVVVLVGSVLAFRIVRGPVRRLLMLQTAALAAVAGLVSGWWYGRNWLLYRGPLGLTSFVQITGPRQKALGLFDVMREAPAIWYSFWGVFGNFSILLPSAYYTGYRILTGLAALGLLATVVKWLASKRSMNPVLMLLIAWLIGEGVLLFRWTAVTSGSTGRLLFPASAGIALLLALGIWTLTGRRAPWFASALLPVALGAAAFLAIPLTILPAYRPPHFVPADQLRPAQPQDIRYGNLLLVGAATPARPVRPGQTIDVTLYWRAVGPVTQDLEEAIALRGPDDVLLATTDTLPGNTELRTADWPAGQGLIDRIPITVPTNAPTPIIALFYLSVYPLGHPFQTIQPTNGTGNAVGEPLLGRAEVRASGPPPAMATAPLGVFAGAMALTQATVPAQAAAGAAVSVTLRWQAITTPATDDTEVIQLVNASGSVVAQRRERPHGGGLPTDDWAAGERVDDTVLLPIAPNVAPGDYRVRVGWQSAAGRTIPLADGTTQLTAATIRIGPPSPAPAPTTILGYRFGNLELVGATLPAAPVTPGSAVGVTLFWRADGLIPDDEFVSVQLHGPDGVLVGQRDVRPDGNAIPTTVWPVGWAVAAPVTIAVNPNSPAPALAHVVVQVYPAGQPGHQIRATREGKALAVPAIGSVQMRPLHTPPAPPPLPLSLYAVLGTQIELVDAETPAQGVAGGALTVILRWQALTVPTGDYTVFVHGTDAAGHIRFQIDRRPHNGGLPTTDWVPGEYVTDTLRLAIPAATAPGDYRLSAGLYDLHSGVRLTQANGSASVALGTTRVTAAAGQGS